MHCAGSIRQTPTLISTNDTKWNQYWITKRLPSYLTVLPFSNFLSVPPLYILQGCRQLLEKPTLSHRHSLKPGKCHFFTTTYYSNHGHGRKEKTPSTTQKSCSFLHIQWTCVSLWRVVALLILILSLSLTITQYTKGSSISNFRAAQKRAVDWLPATNSPSTSTKKKKTKGWKRYTKSLVKSTSSAANQFTIQSRPVKFFCWKFLYVFEEQPILLFKWIGTYRTIMKFIWFFYSPAEQRVTTKFFLARFTVANCQLYCGWQACSWGDWWPCWLLVYACISLLSWGLKRRREGLKSKSM